ncbi:MAG: hypothetical protein FJY44_09735 [Betaproteobacteria bacterium]|nr:hypothetical protein [Betaproteobacteria bacterium]
MTTAYWMVLVAGLMPYWATGVSKWRRSYDNAKPRAGLENLTPKQQRAWWAQLNAFEAFPLFAAAVIIAHLAGAPQPTIDGLAVAFVLLRVAYILAYIHDRPTLRSLLWIAAISCVVALFVVAA